MESIPPGSGHNKNTLRPSSAYARQIEACVDHSGGLEGQKQSFGHFSGTGKQCAQEAAKYM